MRLSAWVAVVAVAVVASTVGAQRSAATAANGIVRLVIETDHGDIGVSLDSASAPLTVTNFLKYVDHGLYDGGRFYRTVTPTNQPQDSVRIGVIQGGANPARSKEKYLPVPLERTSVTGLRHHDGTLSMARAGPNTATTEFFICVGDQPSLDFGGHRNLDGQGFAAFGQTTSGMDVVRAIQAMPGDGQTLTTPVVIRHIRRLEGPAPEISPRRR